MSFLQKYLRSYPDYFWQWEDGGEVLTTADGSTIAYFESVKQLVAGFTKQSVPHFGSLLLVLIALNDNLTDVLQKVSDHLKARFVAGHQAEGMERVLQEAIRFLRIVESLPAQYKTPENRALVVHIVFQQIHNTLSMKESGYILSELSELENITERTDLLMAEGTGFPAGLFIKDFRAVALMLKRFPSVEILRGSIDDTPDLPEDLSIPDEQETVAETGIVSLLKINSTTFQIGALVERIWSGLSIPYKMNMPGGQPLGGISDLTNKGDFDKLLLSEFANDDLVFLSRLANQESLYLRREQPPAADRYERIILIDISIKNWGIPKTLAFAVMTAIANHPRTNIQCTAFAIGDQITELNPYNAEEIRKDFGRVELALNAAQGLEEFLAGKKAKKNTEILYVSNEESTRFPEMIRILNDYHFLFKYWINVERDGQIRVFKNQYKSKRLIQSVLLPLEELWRKPSVKQIQTSEPELTIFPLLFPLISNPIKVFHPADGSSYYIYRFVGVMRLDYEKGRQVGLKLIFEMTDFNKGQDFVLGTLKNGDVILLNYNPVNKTIRFFNLTDRSLNTMHFQKKSGWGNADFFFHEGRFILVNFHERWEFSFTDKWVKKHFDEQAANQWNEIRLKANKKRQHPHQWISGSALRNIKVLGIDTNNNLCFNHHKLIFIRGNLQMESETDRDYPYRAFPFERNLFRFDDRSTIEVSSAGMLTFTSSNPDIETFYIPSYLQKSLAIATETRFAGNDYFYDEDHLNEKVDLEILVNELLLPFIKHILQHEAGK